ncbi:MAG: hypothetical protein II784_06270 [Oscillospiraceae bacterium]|nr:hypothetical protein [Oscillospiraceae bacterium]
MKLIKRLFCIMTALLLVCAAALPAFAVGASETPSGYDAHDYAALRDFFELPSRQGVPNGMIMSEDYDPEDPTTWTGVVWTDGSVKKLYSCSLYDYGYAGVLDLSDCSELELIDCSWSSFDVIIASNCPKLKVLICATNELMTSLDFSGCSLLETLDCSGDSLGSLDLSSFKKLKTLNCYCCELTSLYLGELPLLEYIDCSGNRLTALNVSGCSALRELNCDANSLVSLDVSANTTLRTLFCSDNPLTELNVCKGPALMSLVCMNDKLREIDIAGCQLGVQKLSVSGMGYVGCDLAFAYPQANVVYAYPAAGSEFVKWVDRDGQHIYSQPTAPYSELQAYMTAVFEGGGITGDVNGNGALDTSDALLILRYALQIEAVPSGLEELCDVNSNGVIEAADALLVLRAVLSVETAAYFEELRDGSLLFTDIDGDGQNDTILVESLFDGEDYDYWVELSVTRAAAPEAPIVYVIPYRWVAYAAVADCVADDGRKDILICVDADSNDYSTYALRLNADCSGFEGSSLDVYFEAEPGFTYFRSRGLPMEVRTDIMGTYFLNGRFTVTSEGMSITTPEFTYPAPYADALTLKQALEVRLEDGTVFTVAAGEAVTPYSTDRETYVKMVLPDGRIGIAQVSFRPYVILINGIDQDDLFDGIPYAD